MVDPLGRHPHIVLTYDNAALTDGVGAQLQRMYGIYAISRLLGTSYLHSPLSRVDYQGLAALEGDGLDPDFHHQFNDLFRIPSDVSPSPDFRELNISDLTGEAFEELVAQADRYAQRRKRTLARVVVPYGIADRFPDCYDVCKDISPFTGSPRDGRALCVAIHVRRGELLVVDSDRMLPNAYYISVAQAIADVLESVGIEYQLEVCTEVPTTDLVIGSAHEGIFDRIGTPAILTPDMCRLDEFSVLRHLTLHLNERAIDCLHRLATADILVMSRSSFSCVGGILNRRGIVMYHPFWHRAPSSWITVDEGGRFDPGRLRATVEAY